MNLLTWLWNGGNYFSHLWVIIIKKIVLKNIYTYIYKNIYIYIYIYEWMFNYLNKIFYNTNKI